MRSPQTPIEHRRNSAVPLLLTVCSIALCLLAAGIILATRRWFLQTVDEFELATSVQVRIVTGPLLPGLLAAAGLATLIKEFFSISPAIRTGWNAGTLLLGISLLILYLAAISSTLVTLLHDLAS